MLKMSQVNYIRDLSNSGYRIAEIEDPRMAGGGPACLAEAAAHGQANSRPSPRGGRL